MEIKLRFFSEMDIFKSIWLVVVKKKTVAKATVSKFLFASFLYRFFCEEETDVAVKGVTCGETADTHLLDWPHHNAKAVVEMGINVVSSIFVDNAAVFRSDHIGVCDASGLVAVTDYWRNKQPWKHWNLITDING